MASQLMINHMPWFGWRVIAQPQIDTTTVQFWLAPAEGGIGFFGLTVVKLARQLAMTIRVAGQYDQARGFPVQAVHDSGFRITILLQASHQTVAVVLGAAGYGEQ